MQFASALHIPKGITCLVGGGGKSSLLLRLGQELSLHGRVILCATARMWPPKGVPLLLSPTEKQLCCAMKNSPLVCVGDALADGKLTLNLRDIPLLQAQADYVLAEADGSKGLPMKAHAKFEPVLPSSTAHCVLVVGIEGLGKEIRQVAHRPSLYAQLLNSNENHLLTPRDAAAVIEMENFGDIVYINKVETQKQRALALQLAQNLTRPATMGSLQQGEITPC